MVDPASGVLSPAEKHDWTKQVLQSGTEASRIHACRISSLSTSEAAEDAWWRGARVSRQDAAIVLVGLGIACASPAAAIAEWDGTGQHYDSCPSDQLWRQWVSQGRKCMEGCGLDDLEWFTRGAGSGLLRDLCSEERWMHPQKTECSAVVQCMSTGLRQWVHWVVYPAAEVSIGHGSTKELGLDVVNGVVHLEVLLDRAKVSWTLPVDMDRADGIWVKKSMLENWTNCN